MNPVCAICSEVRRTPYADRIVCATDTLPAARQFLCTKLFLRFVFEALKMYRTRSRVLRGHLAGDLFAQRHAGNESRRSSSVSQLGVCTACTIASQSNALVLPGPAAPPKSRYFAPDP